MKNESQFFAAKSSFLILIHANRRNFTFRARNRKISIDSVDLRKLFEHKTCQKKLWIKRSKFKKTEKTPEFAQNQLYVTFSFCPRKI